MRRRKNKSSVPSKYIFLIASACCVFLMFFSFTTAFHGGAVSTAAGYTFVPIQKGINRLGSWLRDKTDNFTTLQEALDTIDELEEENGRLLAESSQAQQDKYELKQLRELYALDQEYGEYNKVAANVIAKDTGNWFNTFIIDKGSKDGIAVDMNVIAGRGLVGIVTKVSDSWAQVRSIIDDASSISSMILSTSDLCFVEGDLQLMNDGVIRVSHLKDSDNLAAVGDKLVTSPVSEKFHEGILIGYLDTLEVDANNLTKSGTVTPAVDFEHLYTVLVITDLKQQVSVTEE